MRILLLTLLFVCNSIVINAQQNEKIIPTDTLKQLDALIASIHQQPLLSALKDTLVQRKGKRKIPYQVICSAAPNARERTTEWNIREACFNLMITFSQNTFFNLITYSFNDTIYYAALENENLHATKTIYKDSLLLQKAIALHYNFYGHQPDTSEIFNDMNHIYIYSNGCGEIFPPDPPELRVKEEEMIDAKDTATLTVWMCSMNPEKQAYGLEGLSRLKKHRVKINASTQAIMEHVSQLEYPIYSCRGCVMYYPVKFSDALHWHE